MKFAIGFLAVMAAVALCAGPVGAETSWANPSSTAPLAIKGSKDFKVLSKGGEAGPYSAFPDATRLDNGDIMAVFYSGYTHVSLPKANWPKGGRICTVRSSDEGKTWTEPAVLFDDERDNRDPHIAQAKDGTMFVTFFSLMPKANAKNAADRASSGTELLTSHDGGKTWEGPQVIAKGWFVSAPVRQLKNGNLILGIYHTDPKTKEHLGGVVISKDNGKTWSKPHPIGLGQNLPIDAETDVIELKDGRVFAALRSSDKTLHYAYSEDDGETWQPAKDSGFKGHAPHLNRLKDDTIIMAHRLPDTSIHVSRDETKTWTGPYTIDSVFGAYPATVELKDGTVIIIYYTEGKNSEIRLKHFRLTPEEPEFLPLG